ncbi:MAG TPA: class I SAM-dependent methyltransferase [Candidatus Kapabacteria bacterium]|nr:class I SAM-dependent methyltransferase [Candidatus Kapabacteria bacterium]
MALTLPDRASFEIAYAGQAPWDIPGPQKNFVDVADRITGTVLDAGCGTGENALFFAARGCHVTGIDFLEEPIRRARKKVEERNIPATFLVKDALTLNDWNEQFDNVFDSGLFHVFSDDDAKIYVEGLAHNLKPGGHVFLLCFSDSEPGTQGPRRIPKQMIYDRFSKGWAVESVTATRFGIHPALEGRVFSGEAPYAWFAIIRRVA